MLQEKYQMDNGRVMIFQYENCLPDEPLNSNKIDVDFDDSNPDFTLIRIRKEAL